MFVDTSAWYAVAGTGDRCHPVATAYYTALVDEGACILTSDYVIDETITRLRYDFGHSVAAASLDAFSAAIADGLLAVVWVGETAWGEAARTFLRFADQEFSFTDCTSFALARQHKADEVFAFDHHFLTMGFVVCTPVA